jgi:hypothetical protein
MLRRLLLMETTGGVRTSRPQNFFVQVYCVKSMLRCLCWYFLELKQWVDFVLVNYRKFVQVFARHLYIVKQRVDYFLDYLKKKNLSWL